MAELEDVAALEQEDDGFFDSFGEELEEDGEGFGEETPEEDGAHQGEEREEPEDLAQRIEAATEERMAAFFQRQYGGLLNPRTGQPVRTEEDFIQYQQAMEAAEYNQRMAETGIDPGELNELIGNHPAILAAGRLQEEQQTREAVQFAKEQLGTLLSKYPDCGFTDINQLGESDLGKATLQDWAKTGDLVKAYTANFHEEIIKRRTAAAKQGAMNEMNGKRHLRQPQGSGGGGETMSQEEFKTWQGFFPDKGYEEIIKLWKNNKE